MKRRLTSLSLLVFIGVFISACADSEEIDDGARLEGFGSELPRFAVHISDYVSTTIAFLDEEGELLKEDWIHSGTQLPSLVEPLSGDIYLPTEERGDGSFTLIDSFGTDVITRFDLETGALLGQARVRDGFSVNAQDVIYTSDDRAFVLRYGKNLDESAPLFDQGGDLLEIDPETGAPLGTADDEIEDYRVDLSIFSETIELEDGAELVAHTNPSSGIEVSGYLIIGLARFTPGFETAATGAIAIVDPRDRSARLHEFPGTIGCENVSRVPEHEARALVRCQGFYGSTEEDSGAAIIEISEDGSVNTIAALFAHEQTGTERPFDAAVALNSNELIAVEVGEYFSETELDIVYHVSLSDGSIRELFRSSLGGALAGRMAYDATSGLVLIPDANEGVRRLRVKEGGEIETLPTIPLGLGMGVRGIGLLFD